MTSGECPACRTPNRESAICCTMCGKRLPWATVRAASETRQMATGETAVGRAACGEASREKRVHGQYPTTSLPSLELRTFFDRVPRAALWGVALLFLLVMAGTLMKARWPVTPVFDIPALIDKPIQEVQAELGKPTKRSAVIHMMPDQDVIHQKLTWKRGNVELTVTYMNSTGKVMGFYMTTDDPSGEAEDRTRTLALGNIREGSSYAGMSGGGASIEEGPYYSVNFTVGKDLSKHVGVSVYPYS